MRKKAVLIIGAMVMVLSSMPLYANRASVTIDVPESAAKGAQITIKITVTHSGNNFLHHVDWAYINVNGKQIAKWEYSWRNRPESEVFSREVSYAVDGPSAVEAEANCNIHGSVGKAQKSVSVR